MTIPTPKIFQTGAMKVEPGIDAGTPSDGWGEAVGVQALGALDAFPWINFSNKLAIGVTEDDSVITRAFKTTPRMTSKTVDNPVSYYARYKGMNRFHYWMFGFENLVKEVVAFKAGVSPFNAAVTPGDVFVDTDLNDFAFLRTETVRNVNGTTSYIYIFEAIDSVSPTLQTGQMTCSSPANTFDFTSHCGIAGSVMYEHLYEIDSLGRRYRLYTTAEKALLTLAAADKRNLMATFAKRMAGYDLRYKNAMCKNFALKCSAAGLASWDCNLMAFSEERGDYSSADWTLLTGLDDASLIPAHFEYRFGIGTAIALHADGYIEGLIDLGLSDFSLDIETPMQSIQDIISGLSIAEPVLEGKYGIKMTGTISRHTVQTYQGYRDAQTPVVAHLVANQGWFMQEVMIKKATLDDAGAGDEDVAAEALSLNPGYEAAGHEFTEWLEAVTEIHESPVLFRVRDNSNVNEMTIQT